LDALFLIIAKVNLIYRPIWNQYTYIKTDGVVTISR